MANEFEWVTVQQSYSFESQLSPGGSLALQFVHAFPEGFFFFDRMTGIKFPIKVIHRV